MTMSPATGLKRWLRPFLNTYYELYVDLAKELGTGLIDNRIAWEALSPRERVQAMLEDGHPNPALTIALIVPRITSAIAERNCVDGAGSEITESSKLN